LNRQKAGKEAGDDRGASAGGSHPRHILRSRVVKQQKIINHRDFYSGSLGDKFNNLTTARRSSRRDHYSAKSYGSRGKMCFPRAPNGFSRVVPAKIAKVSRDSAIDPLSDRARSNAPLPNDDRAKGSVSSIDAFPSWRENVQKRRNMGERSVYDLVSQLPPMLLDNLQQQQQQQP